METAQHKFSQAARPFKKFGKPRENNPLYDIDKVSLKTKQFTFANCTCIVKFTYLENLYAYNSFISAKFQVLFGKWLMADEFFMHNTCV